MILLFGLLVSMIIGMMEKFIGSKLKMRKNDLVEVFEQPQNEFRNMPEVNGETVWSFLQFKKNHQVNEQIHELETLISEAQNHIQKLSTSLIPENNTK